MRIRRRKSDLRLAVASEYVIAGETWVLMQVSYGRECLSLELMTRDAYHREYMLDGSRR